MYSWEIDNTIKKYNHSLPSSVYVDIINTSPQIIYIKRINDKEFKLVTKDSDDSVREWVFSVFRDTK